jgi:hypothetical protein
MTYAKERPILFSTEMVKAILEGRKTMTRRVIKPQPSDDWMQNAKGICPSLRMYRSNGEQMFWLSNGGLGEITPPYGKPGDVLWVRETFRLCQPYGPESLSYMYKDGHIGESAIDGNEYKYNDYDRWRPSIHMPKVAARIWLEITDIRVERLKMISEVEAMKEGIDISHSDVIGDRYKDYVSDSSEYGHSDHDFPTVARPYESFETLWISINGEESWVSNPWVWVISFKVLSTSGKPSS